jgi:hypothetical protein
MVTLPYIAQLVLNVFVIVAMFAYPLAKVVPAVLRRSKRLRLKRFYRGSETLRKSVLYPVLIVLLRISNCKWVRAFLIFLSNFILWYFVVAFALYFVFFDCNG